MQRLKFSACVSLPSTIPPERLRMRTTCSDRRDCSKQWTIGQNRAGIGEGMACRTTDGLLTCILEEH